MDCLKTLIILFRAHHSLSQQIKNSLDGTSLTINEFTALEALFSKGSLTTHELIGYVLIPNSSMTYVLDTLSNKGFVKRKRNEKDKRIQLISLTPKGEDIFKKAYKIHYKHMRQIFDVLSENEEKQLQLLLKKIGKNH